MGLDRVDGEPKRHADAGVHDDARRGRDCRAHRAASGCGTCPSGCTRPTSSSRRSRRPNVPRTSGGSPRSASPGRGPTAVPVEPWAVGEAGEPAVVEGVEGRVARRSRRARRRRLRGPHGAACRPSTGSSTTGPAPRSCSTSSTSSRCTSLPRSAVGATSRFRSSTRTVWSGRSTPRPTARPPCCG